MLKPIENAEKLYNSFINKQSEKDFFIGFADYYGYLEKHQGLLFCYTVELQKLDKINDGMKSAEKDALEEFHQTYEKIKKDISKNKYNKDEFVIKKYQIIQDRFDGNIASSAPLISDLYRELFDLVMFLLKKDKVEEIRKYTKVFDVKNPKPIDDFAFGQDVENKNEVLLDRIIAPKLDIWRSKNTEKQKEETLSIWGLFTRVRDLFGMFMYCESEYKRLGTKEDATPSEKLHWFFLGTTVAEYNNLMTSRDSSRDNHYFLIRKHINDIERFHTFLTINFIEVEQESKSIANQSDLVFFDEITSKLSCNGKDIGLSRGSNIFHTIKCVFNRNDIYEECFYDEIRDSLDKSKNTSDKNIYDSLLQFNERLSKKGLNDLLIVNYHSVLINPNYKVKSLHDKTR